MRWKGTEAHRGDSIPVMEWAEATRNSQLGDWGATGCEP